MSAQRRNRPFTAWEFLASTLLIGLAMIALHRIYPVGVDWEHNFSRLPEYWLQPYSIPTFTNPPWVLALLPHAWLPTEWGNAVNFLLNVIVLSAVIRAYGGEWHTLLLVFTSPAFLDLARTNNVDWIPALAFLLPAQWGLPLLAIKPQTLGGAALIWWKRGGFSWKMLLPLAGVVLFSFVFWGWWIKDAGLLPQSQVWNFAPWPFGIPLGLYIFWRAYQSNDDVLAAAATPFLTPYFAAYSLAPLLALLGCRYRKEAFFIYCGLWIYVILVTRWF